MKYRMILGLVAGLLISLGARTASKAQDAVPPLEGPKDDNPGRLRTATPPGDEIGILEDDGRPTIEPRTASHHEGGEGGTRTTAKTRSAPPAPKREQPRPSDAPSADAHWIPGYWEWDAARARFFWINGIWKVPPPGLAWVEGRWAYDETEWSRIPGRWEEVAMPGPDGGRPATILTHDVDRIGSAGDRDDVAERDAPPSIPAPDVPAEGAVGPSPGGLADPLIGLAALPEPEPAPDDATTEANVVPTTGRTETWPPRSIAAIDRVQPADRSAPRVSLPGRDSEPVLQGEPSLRPSDMGTPEGPSPAAITAGLASQLAGQSERFYQAIATTSGKVPQGGEMLFEADQLRLAALQLSQFAAQGLDANQMLAAAGQVDAWYGRLSVRIQNVAQGRTRPNIALVAAMGQTCEQIRATLAGRVSGPISPVTATVAGPYFVVPGRKNANLRPAAAAQRRQAQQPRRGLLGSRIGRLLRPR